MGEPMNQIRCLNEEGDEVHVIDNIPDTSLASVLADLRRDGYYVVLIVNSFTRELAVAC